MSKTIHKLQSLILPLIERKKLAKIESKIEVRKISLRSPVRTVIKRDIVLPTALNLP